MSSNPQGNNNTPQSLLRDNMSPRSRGLAMLQQKRFDGAEEESKTAIGNQSENNAQVRMGGRMGSQIQSITNSKSSVQQQL